MHKIEICDNNKDSVKRKQVQNEITKMNSEVISDFEKLVSNCYEILKEYFFIIFHLGRFTPNESKEIRENDLMLPTKDCLITKIKALNMKQEWTQRLIEHINGLEYLKADKCVYFKLGAYQINKDDGSDTKHFLLHWGGETIYDVFANDPTTKEIDNYLKNISYPQIIVSEVKLKHLLNAKNIVKDIILKYPYRLYKISDTIILDNLENVKVKAVENFQLHDKIETKKVS